jgi:hypothetical protein
MRVDEIDGSSPSSYMYLNVLTITSLLPNSTLYFVTFFTLIMSLPSVSTTGFQSLMFSVKWKIICLFVTLLFSGFYWENILSLGHTYSYSLYIGRLVTLFGRVHLDQDRKHYQTFIYPSYY